MSGSSLPRRSRRHFIQTMSATIILSSESAMRILQAAPLTRPAAGPETDRDRLGGTVLFDGDPPKREKLDTRMDPFCTKMFRKDPLLSEDLIVDEQGGLANVFVAITKGLPEREWPVPEAPLVLTERCLFLPHVFGLQAGRRLRIVNDSNGQESPHLRGKKNPPVNFALPRKGMSRDVVLEEAEVVPITCDVHPWERAWCHVVDHPYFAVSDEKGRFSISTKDLEPGRYEITLWHEKLGTQTCNSTLKAETPATPLKITYTPPDARDRGRRRRP